MSTCNVHELMIPVRFVIAVKPVFPPPVGVFLSVMDTVSFCVQLNDESGVF
jgi:hypothetical protein